MKKLQKIVNPVWIVVIIIILVLIGGYYTTYFFKKDVIDQQTKQLSKEIDLLIPFVVQDNGLVLDEEKLDRSVGEHERLTVLDESGMILYDSSKESLAKGSRKNRPEVKQVLEEGKTEGVSIRDSQTVDEKLIYVAKLVYQNNQLIGVIRLSETYQGISQYVENFQRIVITIMALLFVAIFIMGYYIHRQSKKPIQFMLPILRQAIQNPEKKQKVIDAPGEWRELYQTVYKLMEETNLLYYKQLKNEETLQFLFENLDIGIFILNDRLELTLANQTIEEIFRKKWTITPYDEWFTEPTLNVLIKQAVETKEAVQGEIRIEKPRTQDLKIVIRQLSIDNNEYVGIIYDVTEVRQIEQVHEDFISNISHELKTPTTSIIGFSETLLAGAKDDPEASKEFLTIIEREAQRLMSLIQTILMLLKTEKDIYMMDSFVVHPNLVIEDEIDRYRYKAFDKDISVTFESAVGEDLVIPNDSFQIIVKNLLENAIEYSEEHGKIFIYLTQQNNEVTLKVEDTGIGISEEDQKWIFERFYRVSHSRQRNNGGSGLGLSLVKHYAEILGGRVKLVSELGEGTTVIVKINLDILSSNYENKQLKE
ncbi:sensor histidine kinase [Vagococcus luciliae]|uniref:histidine kinase n=1 Tax=Vagococcus luciliae TaxID=2920380 RepID=A0ABY5NZ85_9ENTE|nr:ATP-binding protein [Vagococcus luciliae]UUV98970.1 Alkaline phosphatase synthesis sensor protein PhoR [Vagococcus luciliae]